MAPARIKHVVSFTSEDPKHRVVNLCSGGGSSSLWLCSAAERSGLLTAELQLDRASTIAFIDVGDFLPQAAEESWDRLRVTCSQPFNKRNQFGLAFFRVRTADEHSEEPPTNQETQSTKNQSTTDKMWSVREWISSPPVQHTFFGQKTGESSPGEPTKDHGSRAERMVTAAQSIRRSLHKTSCSSESQKTTQNTQQGPTRTPRVCRRKSETTMFSTPKKSSCGTSDVTVTKKKNNVLRYNPVKSHIAASSPLKSSPDYPEPPETVCPICGVSFSPDFLPLHASSCLESAVDEFPSVTERESALSFSFRPPSGPSMDELMVPCPLCSFRFPINGVQQHASTCGDPVWVD